MASHHHPQPPVVTQRLGDYEVGETVGKGSFGKVKKGKHVPTGKPVAIKALNRQMLTSGNMDAKIRREIKILRLFRHNNICRLYDVIYTETDIFVVMEFVEGIELYDHIVTVEKLSEPDGRYVFQQIICALEYCHHFRVVHRDLKPENLLIDSHLTIKLIDFGLSNLMEDGVFLRTSCGSPNYAAPEVISGRLYAGPEIDVWSSGVVLFALLCGRLPFDEQTIPLLFQKIRRGQFTIPSHISPEAADLLRRLLSVDPLTRITLPQIREHPWFAVRLPRDLQYRPDLFSNAGDAVDDILVGDVTRLTRATAFEVRSALQPSAGGPLPPKLHSLLVVYNILADAKRKREIEALRAQTADEASARSGTAGAVAETASQRELNQGLMLTASPAMDRLLDRDDARSNKTHYNLVDYVPPSAADPRRAAALGGAGSMQAAERSTTTFHVSTTFREKQTSLTERISSSLPSGFAPPTASTAGSGAMMGGHSGGSSQAAGSMRIGSVAKPMAAYDRAEAAVAEACFTGWRVGLMTDVQSGAVMDTIYAVLRALDMEWCSKLPFQLKARPKARPDLVVLMSLLRVQEKHAAGYVVDFELLYGNTLLGLERVYQITDRLHQALG